MEKYFLAVLPPEEILEKAESIKQEIKANFGVKYALKSPAHITLKMPFSYNESKEDVLIQRLREFASAQDQFVLKIGGIDTFGKRVIFLDVEENLHLIRLQSELKRFCKTTLHLVDELSDRNFHPHMTLAFKDLKPNLFEEVLKFVQNLSFYSEFWVKELVLLKRVNHRWIVHQKVPILGSN